MCKHTHMYKRATPYWPAPHTCKHNTQTYMQVQHTHHHHHILVNTWFTKDMTTWKSKGPLTQPTQYRPPLCSCWWVLVLQQGVALGKNIIIVCENIIIIIIVAVVFVMMVSVCTCLRVCGYACALGACVYTGGKHAGTYTSIQGHTQACRDIHKHAGTYTRM